MRLGPGDAFVHQPGVQLVVALEPQPRREEALAHEPDLVLDLALLPARCRRASDRLDKMMRAHLQEAAIVLAILTDEDRLHRGLHVVVDAASTGAFEECERPFVRVEHHLLGLARIRARTSSGCGRGADARPSRSSSPRPSERSRGSSRIGRPRPARTSAAQRHLPSRSHSLCPASRITTDGVIAAVVSERPQLLENPDQGQSLSRRRFDVRRQQPIELLLPSSEFRARLHLTLIRKRRLVRSRTLRTVLRDSLRSRAIS